MEKSALSTARVLWKDSRLCISDLFQDINGCFCFFRILLLGNVVLDVGWMEINPKARQKACRTVQEGEARVPKTTNW